MQCSGLITFRLSVGILVGRSEGQWSKSSSIFSVSDCMKTWRIVIACILVTCLPHVNISKQACSPWVCKCIGGVIDCLQMLRVFFFVACSYMPFWILHQLSTVYYMYSLCSFHEMFPLITNAVDFFSRTTTKLEWLTVHPVFKSQNLGKHVTTYSYHLMLKSSDVRI